jgi:hypothetical protein
LRSILRSRNASLKLNSGELNSGPVKLAIFSASGKRTGRSEPCSGGTFSNGGASAVLEQQVAVDCQHEGFCV